MKKTRLTLLGALGGEEKNQVISKEAALEAITDGLIMADVGVQCSDKITRGISS